MKRLILKWLGYKELQTVNTQGITKWRVSCWADVKPQKNNGYLCHYPPHRIQKDFESNAEALKSIEYQKKDKLITYWGFEISQVKFLRSSFVDVEVLE